MSRLSRLFTQTVVLETYLGSGARGQSYASPVTVPCFIEGAVKKVTNHNAEEVISMTTIYADISTSPDVAPTAGQFSPGSRVTVSGRVSFVITANQQDSAGPVRIHHTQVALT